MSSAEKRPDADYRDRAKTLVVASPAVNFGFLRPWVVTIACAIGTLGATSSGLALESQQPTPVAPDETERANESAPEAGANTPSAPQLPADKPEMAPDQEATDPGTTQPQLPPPVLGAEGEPPADTTGPPTEHATAPLIHSPPAALNLRYTIQAIKVRGNTRTSERVILRYFPFHQGDALDVDDPAVELARFRLLTTGFFRDVQFSLQKGSTRGQVIFIIDVTERNTIILNDVRMGLSANADTQGNSRPLTAYAGIDITELNLGGSGISLGSAVALGQDQLALQLRFVDPALGGSPWMTSSSLQVTKGRDFFGNAQVLYSDPDAVDQRADHAVLRYGRFSGTLGAGRDLSPISQLWLNYRLERVDASFPLEASHLRGTRREPIDFSIIRGQSLLSSLRASFRVDTRDQPVLPTQGWLATFSAETALPQLGSDYDFQRLEARAAHYWRLPWRHHVLKLEGFGGAISGSAPFFEQYFVGDLSDFLPSRLLGMNFDRRPAPNFLGTDIVEVRYGEFAAKLDAEYRIPLYQGTRSVFGIDFFGAGGIYSLASRQDLNSPPEGYSGLARVPVDLTLNLGLRMDTSIGGFAFAFSNILGFIPVRGRGPAGE